MARKTKKMGNLNKVFILHGWTYAQNNQNPLEKWDDFLNELRAQNIPTHLLQVPGLIKNTDLTFTLDDYVSWLKKTLEREKEKVVLIGHSNGGRIAFAFAAEYPNKVEHLVLIDSAGILHNKPHTRLKRFLFRNIAKIGKKIVPSEKLRVLLYKLAREGDYKNATPAQRQTMANLIYLDLTKTLKKVKVPTLIIWGKQDKITPLSDGQKIQRLINNSKLFVINEARHAPQFSHPKEVVEDIVKELSSLSS